MKWITATCALLCVAIVGMDSSSASDIDDVPIRALKTKFASPVLKFLRFSDIKVEAGNYPPPQAYQLIASILSITKFILIGCVLAGINPFSSLGMETPQIYQWAQENTIYAVMMTFFISNAIETQLISTGAFEISLNDVTVWSKLQSGRIPRVDELLQIIEYEMKGASNFDSKHS